MASLPMAIGQAPPQPPDVAAQMGAGPGLGPIAARMQGGPDQQSQPNPHGALLSQATAVKAVLEQMAGTEPGFAPYARQAISAIADGVSAVSTAPAPQAPPELASAPAGMPVGGGIPMA